MADSFIRLSKMEDVWELSPHVRAVEIKECMELGGLTPAKALYMGVKMSTQCYTMMSPVGVVGMFGVAPSPNIPDAGVAWLLTSPSVYDRGNVTGWLRRCPEWVAKMQAEYPVLYNYISVQNVEAIRWLQWLGFRLSHMHDNLGGPGKAYYEIVRF